MNGRRYEAGGNEHKDDARDPEETCQVDAPAAMEHAPADECSDDDTDQCAEAGGQREPLAWNAANRKTDVSKPSRSTARTAIGRGPGSSGGQGSARCFLEVALEAARVAAHPHDHVRDHHDRNHGNDGLERLLLCCGRLDEKTCKTTAKRTQAAIASAMPSHTRRRAPTDHAGRGTRRRCRQLALPRALRASR